MKKEQRQKIWKKLVGEPIPEKDYELLQKAIIIEIGSRFTKLWGKKKNQPDIIFHRQEDAEAYYESEKWKYVGEAALQLKDRLNLFYPIEQGIITNWEAMKKIWGFAFFFVLRVDPREYPVL